MERCCASPGAASKISRSSLTSSCTISPSVGSTPMPPSCCTIMPLALPGLSCCTMPLALPGLGTSECIDPCRRCFSSASFLASANSALKPPSLRFSYFWSCICTSLSSLSLPSRIVCRRVVPMVRFTSAGVPCSAVAMFFSRCMAVSGESREAFETICSTGLAPMVPLAMAGSLVGEGVRGGCRAGLLDQRIETERALRVSRFLSGFDA
mmetsp:Transcript_25390/g.60749  ORF Transcript_25390/g.60749 Transcript_25390/m.60749 type:complete len:209 (+) Transcript_25390:389-1015(+)